MYLDSAYIAKFYLNEADSQRVRGLLSTADTLVSSIVALGEVTCAFHRQFRQGILDSPRYSSLLDLFLEDVDAGNWMFIPVTERLMRKMVTLLSALPPTIYLRAGDAIHLTAALDIGEREIWSSDRHLLAAAGHFGLTGRSA